MQEHNITPVNFLSIQLDKDTNSNQINAALELDKYIQVENIAAEPEVLFKHVNEAVEKQSNKFPVEVFPLQVQRIISATNENLNFPIDFIGASLLYAVSIATGNTHKVEVKKGWLESAVIYLAIVARAGTNKSHPLSMAIQPITERDKRTYQDYQQEKQKFDEILNIDRKVRKKQGIPDPIKPVWQKFLLSDFTPEALAEVHKHNKRGIGACMDELAGWFKNFNRYNKGSEMEFWLSIWSGKPVIIDRKSGEPTFIPMPFISVAGTMQKGILNELAKESRTQNGFIDRIIFVFPDDLHKPYWSDTEINPDIIEDWHNIISSLLDIPIQLDETSNPKPELLRLTPEAKKSFIDWERKNTNQCNNSESEAISGIFSKMEIYVFRLALILEMMRFACNESDKKAIGIEAMIGALKLVEYFKYSAIRINSIILNTRPIDKYPEDKQALFGALPDTFSTEQGILIAEALGVPERTFKRFLNENDLFKRLARGEYKKNI